MAKLEPPTMRSHHLVAARVESPGVGWSRAREICRRGDPPGRGKREIQKLLHVPSPKARQNLILAGVPRPLGDVASFGDDTPTGIRICRGSGVADDGTASLSVLSPQDPYWLTAELRPATRP